MKKLLKSILSLGLIALMFSLPLSVSAQSNNEDEIYWKTAPGTEAWEKFSSHQEMIDACQIPQQTLVNMSTEELLHTVLRYPLLGDMYAYNSIQDGFEALRKQFNGINVLLTRKDLPSIIYNVYSKTSVLTAQVVQDTISFNDFYKLSTLEILMLQPEVKQNTSKQLLSKMNSEAHNKTSQKLNSGVYGTAADTYYQVKQSLGEADFTQSYGNFTEISPLSNPSQTPTYVYTPKGTRVSAYKISGDISSLQKKINDNWVKNTYPGVTLLASSTAKYNCHSYAWYSASTSNTIWINDPGAYMRDGSYRSAGYQVNAKIYYGASRNEHSGIISSVKVGMPGGYVTSKWGELGLVNHFYTNCPYYASGTPISLWA